MKRHLPSRQQIKHHILSLDKFTLLYFSVPILIVILMLLLKLVFDTNVIPHTQYTRLNIWKAVMAIAYGFFFITSPLPLFFWLRLGTRNRYTLLHTYSALAFGLFFTAFSYTIAQVVIDFFTLIFSGQPSH